MVVVGPAAARADIIVNINTTPAANTSVRPILLRPKQAKSFNCMDFCLKRRFCDTGIAA